MKLENYMYLETYENPSIYGGKILYRIYIPKTKRESYRAVIFFHGAGERGDDGLKHIQFNTKILEYIINHPKYKDDTIIIAPQIKETEYWIDRSQLLADGIYSFENTPYIPVSHLWNRFLDYDLLKKFPIDPKHIHLIGLSMGAGKTADLIARFPEKFASAILICGKIDLNILPLYLKTPIWMFHSIDDQVVNPNSYIEANKFFSQNHKNYRFTLYQDAGHGSWNRAYEEKGILDWLFSFSR